VYVDDIIFGSTKKSLCVEFEQMMHKRFQMSSIGELTFFLGLQVQQKEDGIFISQDKYVHDIQKKFDFITVKTASTPIKPNKALLKDKEAKDLDVLWIQNQMLDYGFNFMNTKIYIDNESTICIVKNSVFHSKTKHKEIRHHFIRDSHEKKLIQDRQSSMVGFGEMRQLEVLRLILEEIGYNCEGFQEIVKFLNGSHIMYALTKNPTIYVSLIKKFWQTATVRTVDNGEQEINATVDGKEFTITEASETSLDGGPRRQETMRGASVQTRFERASKLSYDLPLGGGNTPRSDEDSMTLQELTALCTKFSDRVLALETDLRQTKKVYGTASQEDQPEDQLGVLSAAKVLADAARVHTYSRRRRAISTGSGGVSTASRIVSTAGMIQQVNIIIPSLSATKDKEDEWEDIKERVEADEELTQKLQAEERDKYSEVDQARMLVDLINQRKRYFAAQKAKAKRNKPMTQAQQITYMHVSTFTSIETEDKERESELEAGSSKRPRAEHDEQHDKESVNKQKLEENDAEKEELRAYLDIVPGDEIAMDFESLATKYPIID
ncbi:putative ribonuclease H-like domain-containing protein, partial [Tanacetum coccineum]